MLYLESARATYQGKIALDDISLQVPSGQKLAIVGHSGSGKSTLLKLFYEHRPVGISAEDIAVVPQDYGLVKSLSVFHNVYMGQLGRQPVWYNLVNLLKPLQAPVHEVRAILEQLTLGDKLFEPVGQLSGGQKQRTAIARALMQRGKILLADEPVSSLDEQQSNQVMATMCGHFDTVVLALHDIDLALAHCDRIVGLDRGRVVIDASAGSLTRDQLLALYGD